MTAQHTRGPWKVCKNGITIIQGGKSPRQNICTATQVYMDRGEREANAHLIAAAPDMYDELRNTEAYITLLTEGFAWLQKHHANVPQGQSIDQWIENMMMALNARFRGNRAAINRARGQI